jgi:MFS family permease
LSSKPEIQEQRVNLLPWKAVAILFGTICAAALMSVLIDPATLPAGIGGALVGLFSTIFGNIHRAALAACLSMTVTIIGFFSPDWVWIVFVIPIMAAFVGLEVTHRGSKSLVFAIMAWILMTVPAGAGVGWPLIGVFMLAAILGTCIALFTGLEGRLDTGTPNRAYGISLFLGLCVGLWLAFVFASFYELSYSFWIAMLFTSRALDPPASHRRQALIAGYGTVFGAALAGISLMLPLPPGLFTGLGVLLLILGLRLIPLKSPLSPALISVIFAAAPNHEIAVFRIEAAIIAATLAMVLSFTIEVLRRRIENSA